MADNRLPHSKILEILNEPRGGRFFEGRSRNPAGLALLGEGAALFEAGRWDPRSRPLFAS